MNQDLPFPSGVAIQSVTALMDPVELDPIGHVRGAMGAEISNLIQQMLLLRSEERDSAEQFIDPWQGIFQEAVDRAVAAEGRAF